MRERRKSPRIELQLPIELRREKWESFITQDISRRGIYVRISASCSLGQLMQLRVRLPGDQASLEMMARVARRRGTWEALAREQLPGVGLEFFCLSDEVIARWDQFIQQTMAYSELDPAPSAEELYELLEQHQGRRGVVQASPLKRTPKVSASRSNLIVRPQNRAGLERFLYEDLIKGRFVLSIPYKMDVGKEVGLRVIHPSTLEEFLVVGILHAGEGREGYEVRFGTLEPELLEGFRDFVVTGRLQAEDEGAGRAA